jgi:hypothetical protein
MSETNGQQFLQEAVPPTASRRGVVALPPARGLLGLLGVSLLLLGGLRA